ncbi:MAG: lipopolysaccharide biosynthesis protein [Candidatus Gastranaerophilaceae bacterium]
MRESVLSKNYFIIWDVFLKYLPSRFFIILNSLVIIPFFAHVLSSGEMGIFQISIGILNLVCTCSTDWISKTTLRFWVKYKRKNELESFFSNIFFMTIISYTLIFVLYFCFSDLICAKFFIAKNILLLTLFLVIPCGLRQFLYQMLRIFNKPFLYTFSIIIYQISLLCLFLVFSNIWEHVFSILTAMSMSIFAIDLYILKQIDLKNKLSLKLTPSMLQESLKYSLPLIITNVSLWSVFHVNKFIFQYDHYFTDTAIAGIAWFFTTSILAAMFSTFLFSVFPTIIKQFEKKRIIKEFVTNTIQLYFVIFIPFVAVFSLFSREISNIFLSEKYSQACVLLPFFAVSIFGHELLKLINIKYHLKNKTYVEMVLSLIVGLISLGLNIILIPKFHILAVGIVMLFSILLLIIANSLIKFNSIDYIIPKKVFKSATAAVLIALTSFSFVFLLFGPNGLSDYLSIAKIVVFFALSYLITWQFRARILE